MISKHLLRKTSIVLIALAASALLLAAPMSGALPGDPVARYSGAGTTVVATSNTLGFLGFGGTTAIVDDGVVGCSISGFGTNATKSYTGNGGVCLPFNAMQGDSLFVKDDTYGTKIAFQVCVDNNGDGLCTLGGNGPCSDDIRFSHDGSGAFYNPIFVWQLRANWTACGGHGFAGYIVILCQGAHADPTKLTLPDPTTITIPPPSNGGLHTHQVSTGSVEGAWTGGTPSGDYCGGPTAVKAYQVDDQSGGDPQG